MLTSELGEAHANYNPASPVTKESFAVHENISDVSSSEFAAYVKDLHRDADKGFSQQYMALQAHSPRSLPCTTAQLEKNLPKNRYNNILPCKSFV